MVSSCAALPRYDGLQEVFVSTATAALEVGAMPYAKGLIDNQFKYYVHD